MSLPLIILGIGVIWAVFHLIKGMIKLAVLVIVIAVGLSLFTSIHLGTGLLHFLW